MMEPELYREEPRLAKERVGPHLIPERSNGGVGRQQRFCSTVLTNKEDRIFGASDRISIHQRLAIFVV